MLKISAKLSWDIFFITVFDSIIDLYIALILTMPNVGLVHSHNLNPIKWYGHIFIMRKLLVSSSIFCVNIVSSLLSRMKVLDSALCLVQYEVWPRAGRHSGLRPSCRPALGQTSYCTRQSAESNTFILLKSDETL